MAAARACVCVQVWMYECMYVFVGHTSSLPEHSTSHNCCSVIFSCSKMRRNHNGLYACPPPSPFCAPPPAAWLPLPKGWSSPITWQSESSSSSSDGTSPPPRPAAVSNPPVFWESSGFAVIACVHERVSVWRSDLHSCNMSIKHRMYKWFWAQTRALGKWQVKAEAEAKTQTRHTCKTQHGRVVPDFQQSVKRFQHWKHATFVPIVDGVSVCTFSFFWNVEWSSKSTDSSMCLCIARVGAARTAWCVLECIYRCPSCI